MSECDECGGRGWILDAPSNVLDGHPYEEPCPKCTVTDRGDPATLRALADGISKWMDDDAGGYDQAIFLLCEIEPLLRACADAQERPTATVVDHGYDCGCYWASGNLVACPEHSPEQARISARLKAEAPAAPAAPECPNCGWDGGLRRYCDAHNPCFPLPGNPPQTGEAITAAMRKAGYWPETYVTGETHNENVLTPAVSDDTLRALADEYAPMFPGDPRPSLLAFARAVLALKETK